MLSAKAPNHGDIGLVTNWFSHQCTSLTLDQPKTWSQTLPAENPRKICKRRIFGLRVDIIAPPLSGVVARESICENSQIKCCKYHKCAFANLRLRATPPPQKKKGGKKESLGSWWQIVLKSTFWWNAFVHEACRLICQCSYLWSLIFSV